MSTVELNRTKIAVITQIETAVAELRETYMGLAIAGPEDRKGYLAVSEARKDVKARRVKVEHARKALKEDALAYGRLVDGEAKRITAMLEPIEQHLQEQEDGYEAAREAIKRKEAEAKAARLQARADAIGAVGGRLPLAVLESLTDEQFAAELLIATQADEARKASEAAKAKEDADRKAEADRLRKIEDDRIASERAKLEAERKAQEEQARIEREKLEAERKRQSDILAEERRKTDEAAKAERQKLEDERRMQAEAQRKIDAENNRLAAERQRIEREEFERNAKAKAEQEAREKLERERVEQERKDAEAKAEAVRREAMKPDLQKFREYLDGLRAIALPEFADEAVIDAAMSFFGDLCGICNEAETWIDEQGE